MSFPGILIAGTGSGCGKTTTAMAVMGALKKKGYIVQPFKVGPDYIDPIYHKAMTGRNGIQLDSFLLSSETVRGVFEKHSETADISVVEGVMGLYDGLGYTTIGSTAEIAKLLGIPVVLVVNAKGMSASVAALIHGFQNFDRDIPLKGVIFSRVKNKMMYRHLKNVVEENTSVQCYGYLEEKEAFSFSSRHLGLDLQIEKEKLEQLAEQALSTLDLDKLLVLARECTFQEGNRSCLRVQGQFKNLPIGVAMDEAFQFYYQDNLELLRHMGAEIVPFSPLRDKKLPEGIKGLYIGGGYPELYGKELEANRSLREEIYKKGEEGLPIYAECGGLMYLSQKLILQDSQAFDMVGIFQGSCQMTDSLRHFGYVTCKMEKDCILGKAGTEFRAHEFHYSKENLENETVIQVMKIRDNLVTALWDSGYVYKNVIGSYPHIHFLSNPSLAHNFLKSAWECDKSC